jgi:hypothetical protein
MARHPAKIHGIPAAGVAGVDDGIRRALNAITRAENFCPLCFEFRGRDARRQQMHVRDEKIQRTVDPQGSLSFTNGQLTLNINVTLTEATQEQASTAPLRQTADGLEMKVLPQTADFTGGSPQTVQGLVNELNEWLELWRRAGYVKR